MAEKAATLHQPVISIRISEELRSRLETLKEVIGLNIRGRKTVA
jgi:predicted DNA-binding protein